MANKSSKVAENVAGKFYVDDQCIGCEACLGIAGDNFKMSGDSTHAYVFKQPAAGSAEEQSCSSAVEGCPVQAIGDDGV